jgi:AraC-like DNA-binding protein
VLHADDRDRLFVRHVHTLAPRCEKVLTPSGFEEDFLLLANALLAFYDQVHQEMARVPAARAATKKELYRRLLVGREYIHAHASDEVSLVKVAKAACLSPFHFHRGFTKAFGQTPHSYVTGLRLAEAKRLLEAGVSALDACLDVGFSSPSAFSRLFRSQFGHPPSAIRRNFARSARIQAPILAHFFHDGIETLHHTACRYDGYGTNHAISAARFYDLSGRDGHGPLNEVL